MITNPRMDLRFKLQFNVWCRNNDGYITKKEMLSSTTKLTRSQVGLDVIAYNRKHSFFLTRSRQCSTAMMTTRMAGCLNENSKKCFSKLSNVI